MTPFQKGRLDAREGKPGPAFPRGNASWSDRLYALGWASTPSTLAEIATLNEEESSPRPDER